MLLRRIYLIALFLGFYNCGAYLLTDRLLFSEESKQPQGIAKILLATMNVGLIHYWPLDGDANDRVGSLHLSPSGTTGPTITSDHNGLPGGAFHYDGIDAGHDAGGAGEPILTGIASFTLSAWVRGKFPQTGSGNNGIFLAQGSGLGLQFYALTSNCTNRIRSYSTNGGVGVIDVSSPCYVYSDDIWYHVTLTWDLPNNTASLYVNNNLISSAVFDPNQTPWTSSSTFTLGYGALSGYFHNGDIDEVRVYDRVAPPFFFSF